MPLMITNNLTIIELQNVSMPFILLLIDGFDINRKTFRSSAVIPGRSCNNIFFFEIHVTIIASITSQFRELDTKIY